MTNAVSTKHRGATLVEVTVATALVSVVVVASLETLGGAARSHQMAMTETDAVNLAEDMIAEVTARDYADPQGGIGFGLDAGESRATARTTLDDVDDYDVLDEATCRDRSGAVLTAYSGWTRKTRVRYVNRNRNAGGDLPTRADDQGLKWVSVEVIDPQGVSRTFAALRSMHGPGELHPAVNTGVVRGVEVSIEAGGGARVTAAAASANESRAP